jgi:general secretion pathway protein D
VDESSVADDDRGFVEYGSGRFESGVTQPPPPQPSTSEQTVALNFNAAPLSDVIRTVLGSILQLNYTVEGDSSAPVTLHASIPVNEVLATLEELLATNDRALVWDGQSYHVVTRADALKAIYGGTSGSVNIRVIALRYISVSEVRDLLSPFVRPDNIVRTDSERNLIILGGTPAELDSLAETIASFDVSQASAYSFALVKLEQTAAGVVIDEAMRALGGHEGRLPSGARLLGIDRLNAILIVSPQPAGLREAREWLLRLDRSDTGDAGKIHVYEAKNVPADQLAQVAIATLGGQLPADDAEVPVAPGLATATQSAPALATSSGQPAVLLPAPPDTLPSGQTRGPHVYDVDRIHIVSVPYSQKLIVVASAEQYRRILGIFRQLDAPPLQVLVEVTIAEVDLVDDLSYGVEWYLRSHLPSGTGMAQLDLGDTGLNAQTPGFSYGFASTGGNLQVVLNTLAKRSMLHILATPHIFVADRHTAEIQVGDQVPILTQQTTVLNTASAANTINAIDYHETGVILKVTPIISRDGAVQLDIFQEVSQVKTTLSSGLDSPTFSRRALNSTIVVASGHAAFLGGLLQNNDQRDNTGIPFLKDLPVVGSLFGTTNNSHERTELVIVIKPIVVHDTQGTDATLKQLREKLSVLKDIR